MPLPLIAAAGSALPAIFQTLNGLNQNRKANRMKVIRPDYEIPSAAGMALNTAQNMANAAMPGYGNAVNGLRAATASGVRSAQMSGSSNNALAAIAAMQGNEANSMNNLADQNADFKMRGLQNLQDAQNQYAGYQQKAWDWNEQEKYFENAAAKAALKEAGLQNINSGLGGIGASMNLLGSMSPKQIPAMQNMAPVSTQNLFQTAWQNSRTGYSNGFPPTPQFYK